MLPSKTNRRLVIFIIVLTLLFAAGMARLALVPAAGWRVDIPGEVW